MNDPQVKPLPIHRRTSPGTHLVGCLAVACLFIGSVSWAQDNKTLKPKPGVKIPVVVGNWWPVANNPMDHPYATERQEPVDFAVWQAKDGTWQLWSCLRRTTAGGNQGTGRLFYRWEGQNITDANWKPMGIAMESNTELGEYPGGLQAPHVVKVADTFHMFYGDWTSICHATSKDGKHFDRVIQPNGKTGIFEESPKLTTRGVLVNTRDIMMLNVKGLWHGYYTACPERQGPVYCRTTQNFNDWSDSTVVAFGGQAGTGRGSGECPHVVQLDDNNFYLFRTQNYGPYKDGKIRDRRPPQTSVYHSSDPMMFGINQDSRYFVTHMEVAAPEIVFHEGIYYIVSLNTGSLDGVRIARLEFKTQ